MYLNVTRGHIWVGHRHGRHNLSSNKRKKMSSVFPVQMDTVHVHSKGGRPRRGQAGRQAGKIELAGSKGERH